MLIAVLSFRRVSSDTGTTVRDRPSLTASSGHFGALSRLSHWPRWICAGWGTLAGADYLEFMRRRLIVLRELLAVDGTIFVHLDKNMVFEIKLIMDDVFGLERF